MQVELPDDFVARMRALAKSPLDSDDEDFEVHSHAGGNIDDAYTMGVDEGEKALAQEIASYFPEEN